MLKISSKAKLHRIATNDILFGGATAMVLAKRIKESDGMDIVSEVYSSSNIQDNPYILTDCKFCGSEYYPAKSEHVGFCGVSCAEAYYS